jgi:hypothetical protein
MACLQAFCYCAEGKQAPAIQRLGAMQSPSFKHGNTHLPNCGLQWWVAQFASLEQGRASGPGADSGAAAAGAAAGATPGAAAGAAAGAAPGAA